MSGYNFWRSEESMARIEELRWASQSASLIGRRGLPNHRKNSNNVLRTSPKGKSRKTRWRWNSSICARRNQHDDHIGDRQTTPPPNRRRALHKANTKYAGRHQKLWPLSEEKAGGVPGPPKICGSVRKQTRIGRVPKSEGRPSAFAFY